MTCQQILFSTRIHASLAVQQPWRDIDVNRSVSVMDYMDIRLSRGVGVMVWGARSEVRGHCVDKHVNMQLQVINIYNVPSSLLPNGNEVGSSLPLVVILLPQNCKTIDQMTGSAIAWMAVLWGNLGGIICKKVICHVPGPAPLCGTSCSNIRESIKLMQQHEMPHSVRVCVLIRRVDRSCRWWAEDRLAS